MKKREAVKMTLCINEYLHDLMICALFTGRNIYIKKLNAIYALHIY